MDSHGVNSIGLLLDIAGALLIFFYGIPEPISRHGATYLVTGMTDEAEKRKARRYDLLSRIGLALIVGGFAAQLLSNYI